MQRIFSNAGQKVCADAISYILFIYTQINLKVRRITPANIIPFVKLFDKQKKTGSGCFIIRSNLKRFELFKNFNANFLNKIM